MYEKTLQSDIPKTDEDSEDSHWTHDGTANIVATPHEVKPERASKTERAVHPSRIRATFSILLQDTE